jgi:uncharacterized alpha-E superfamily protein
VADESNPRSLAYQVVEILGHLNALPRESAHPRDSADRQRAFQLRTFLQLADLSAACAATGGRREGLDALLGEVFSQLSRLSEEIAEIYFIHSVVPQELRTRGPETGA